MHFSEKLSGKQIKYSLLSCPKCRHVDFRVLILAVEENSGASGIATTTGDMSYCLRDSSTEGWMSLIKFISVT